MSLLLLDTTFLINTERQRLDLDEIIGDDDDVAIAAITLAEMLVGVKLASGKRQVARRAFTREIMESVPIIAYDAPIAEAHADLLVTVRGAGKPRGAHDLLIAATARATDRAVVTADLDAFADLPGVSIVSHR